MKKFLLSTAVVLALTAAGGAAYKAAADTGPLPPPPGAAPPPGQWNSPGPCPWDGPGRSWGPWGPGGKGQGVGGPGRDQKFSLFAPTQNKNLSTADVKTIGTAILLEHGNHDWGVSNIVPEPDKSIQFSFTTQHGDVIATFAIDPASGHMKRVS